MNIILKKVSTFSYEIQYCNSSGDIAVNSEPVNTAALAISGGVSILFAISCAVLFPVKYISLL